MGHVLVVEDNPAQADAIVYALEKEGYEVVRAESGIEALEQARRHALDAVILDLGLPGIDGFQVCQTLRRDSTVPILVLTARDGEEDLLRAFSLGADDYLTKPFRYREMLARVGALLRRGRRGTFQENGALQVGRLRIDLDLHQVSLEGRLLPLTPAEFRLLEALIRNRGHVMSCRALLQYALDYDASDAEAREIVRVHIWRLRNKMDCIPEDEEYIQNIRGIGYTIY